MSFMSYLLTEEEERAVSYLELVKQARRDGPPGPKGPAPPVSPVTNIRIARAGALARGDDERRLLTAGWSPKVRSGLVIWANPETGSYCSREVALHRLDQETGAGGGA